MNDSFDFDFDIDKTIKEEDFLTLMNNSFNGMDDNSENEEKSNFLFAQYFKDEGELLEVDYSAADKLKADLLEKKRIKKATRDASRLYKSVYGKNNDGVGEDDFIEEYLVENGLKQKALPEPKLPKKYNFMDKYPTKKSEEESEKMTQKISQYNQEKQKEEQEERE